MATAIEIGQLNKWYYTNRLRRVSIVENLSLEVNAGEIFGFLGANGAGKTTTIKMIMGLSRPSSGTITLLGYPAHEPVARKQVGFLPEHPQFPKNLTAFEFMKLSASLSTGTSSDLDSLLEKVGLIDARQKKIEMFSKGMQQRLGIAQALIGNPHLLIFDEPMSGLDPIGRNDVSNLIMDLAREGRTVFFSTHILSDAQLLCDRIAFLKKGKLLKVYGKHGFEQDEPSRTLHVTGISKDSIQRLKEKFPIEFQHSAADTWRIDVPNNPVFWAVMDMVRQENGYLLSTSINVKALQKYWGHSME
ncbi:MAG: ABC transporter ATP-binding protein [SAR324 cluster bacterium]|nr:ABC transporter ATP-binding protein [SAR324 cluster bacterium]